jgi:hypothetical protein
VIPKCYRLEAQRAGGGPHLFPRVFPFDDAVAFAEAHVDRLAEHPGWRVRGFRVLELPSLRVVTNVLWHDPEHDPDPFDQALPGFPGVPGRAGGAVDNAAGFPSPDAGYRPGPAGGPA